jgi:predicted nucleic acid-binding protein
MRPVVYIESSIISYLTARPSRDVVTASRQAITAEWWRDRKDYFEVYISALVMEEIAGGDPVAAEQRLQAVAIIASLVTTKQAEMLAKTLLESKAIPANSTRDALHIAIAATQGVEFLLTWKISSASTTPKPGH